MKFDRKVEIHRYGGKEHDVGDFLNDRDQITEFLDAIENAESFEDVFVICSKYLKYGIDGDYDIRTDDYIRTNFYDDSGNKYFITFFIYWNF